MKETKDLSTSKGITLIALVITIIVMLILVAVTISMAVNGGLFDYAGRAVSETNNALKSEQDLANGGIEVDGTWYNNIDEYLNKDTVETISKPENYVGCYADVDGDGTVDGVIYADLVFEGSGKSGGYSYSYEAVAAEELKDYTVSGTYNGDFNEEGTPREVVTAVEGTTGADRFYVMALEDISTTQYTWYKSKATDGIEVSTETGFGTGKTNTETMLSIWNEDTDESKSSYDVWGNIQSQVSNGWFLPSQAEWSVFLDTFDVTSEWDYENSQLLVSFGLRDYYWSSTQLNSSTAFCMNLHAIYWNETELSTGGCYVRLSTTF